MDNSPTDEVADFIYDQIRQFRGSRRPLDFEDTERLLADYVAKMLDRDFVIRWEMR